jgi:hypothetical protein
MAHNNLGIVLSRKAIDEAIRHYPTTEMQPDFWDADYNLGTALWVKARWTGNFYCDKAVRMQPNDPDARGVRQCSSSKTQSTTHVHYQKAVAIRRLLSCSLWSSHACLRRELDAAIEHSRLRLINPNNADITRSGHCS